MRKITQTLMMLVVMLLSLPMMAQSPVSVEQLSNSKVYTIACERCFFQHVEGATSFYTSSGSADGVVTTADASDPNQQFALLKGASNYYLYSVGAKQFINNDGSYSTGLSQNSTVKVKETSNATYPICIYFDDSNYINCQDEGSSFASGYVINSWSTLDKGNQFAVVEAAEIDLSDALAVINNFENNAITITVKYSHRWGGVEYNTYSTSTTGSSPMEITFDEPATYLGAVCKTETPATQSYTETKTVDVIYEYELDSLSLPIVPATIKDGQFAKDTKWYYLSPAKKTTYAGYVASQNSGNGGLVQDKNITSAPAETKYFYTFTGNPLAGFQIHNYLAGAEKGLTASDPSSPYDLIFSNAPSNFYLEKGTSDGQYRFCYVDYKTSGTGLSYVDGYYNPMYLYTWSYASGWSSYAATDEDAQIYIQDVTDDLLELALNGQIELAGITPAEGKITEPISTISLLFEEPIYRVYSQDNEGAGMDGEDIPMVVQLTDNEGNVVQEYELEGSDNGYCINEENPKQLDFYLKTPISAEGTYVLHLPKGLVFNEKGHPNAEHIFTYELREAFEEVTVTARVYNSSFGDFSGEAWPASLLPYDETLGYYNIKVKVSAKDEVTFLDYTGKSGENLTINFNEEGEVLLVDGEEADSYGSYWAESSVLDGDYKGYYLYYSPSTCKMTKEEDGVLHGTAAIAGYEYASWTKYYQFIEWYTDDRLAKSDEVIACESITPDEGEVEALSEIHLTFSYDFTELRDAVVTLTDENGYAAGGTLTVTINDEHKNQLDITLSEPITADGLYTLALPTGVAAREGLDNSGYSEAVTVTYQIGEIKPEEPAWTTTAYDYVDPERTDMLFTEGNKFDNITVSWYEKSRHLIIRSFMGGDQDLDIAFDTDGKVTTINGQEKDSYGSFATYTGNSEYYYAYLYAVDHSSSNIAKKDGFFEVGGYFYTDENDNNGTWKYYRIAWNIADEILAGKIHNTAIAEAGEGFTGTAWTQLPYGEDGTYDVKVRIDSDNKFTILNYTGVEGENKTIEFNSNNNQVVTIDGTQADQYGTVWCTSSVLDGTSYNGYYEFVGEYSYAGYDSNSKTGYAVLLGVDYTDPASEYGDDRYLFLTFGNSSTPDADALQNVQLPKSTLIYNLQGQRLFKVQKGINIVNGKKVVIK